MIDDELAVNLPGVTTTLYGVELKRDPAAKTVTVRVYQGRDSALQDSAVIIVDQDCVMPWHRL